MKLSGLYDHQTLLHVTSLVDLREILRIRHTITNYNLGHNILEFCNILVQIRFTPSKRKLDI